MENKITSFPLQKKKEGGRKEGNEPGEPPGRFISGRGQAGPARLWEAGSPRAGGGLRGRSRGLLPGASSPVAIEDDGRSARQKADRGPLRTRQWGHSGDWDGG